MIWLKSQKIHLNHMMVSSCFTSLLLQMSSKLLLVVTGLKLFLSNLRYKSCVLIPTCSSDDSSEGLNNNKLHLVCMYVYIYVCVYIQWGACYSGVNTTN